MNRLPAETTQSRLEAPLQPVWSDDATLDAQFRAHETDRSNERQAMLRDLTRIETAFPALLSVPENWYLLMVNCEPVIVRLLLRSELLERDLRKYRVMCHHFLTPEAREEIPWLSEAFADADCPAIPWHRHNWRSASFLLDGVLSSVGGLGSATEPPQRTTAYRPHPREWRITDRADFWHLQRLETPSASKLFIAERRTFADVPLPDFRPRVTLVEDETARAEVVAHFRGLMLDISRRG